MRHSEDYEDTLMSHRPVEGPQSESHVGRPLGNVGVEVSPVDEPEPQELSKLVRNLPVVR